MNGNVGIGTTSPGAKLDVAGTARVTGNVSGAGTNYLCVRKVDSEIVTVGGTLSVCPVGKVMTGSSAMYDCGGGLACIECSRLVLSSVCP